MAEKETNKTRRIGEDGLSLEDVKIRIKDLWLCDPMDSDEDLQQQFLESTKVDWPLVVGAIEEIIKELWDTSRDTYKIHRLLTLRQQLLNAMFKGSAEEMAALKALNETLAKLEDELNTKSLQLWNFIKQSGIYTGEWLVRGMLDVVSEEVHHIAWGYFIDKYAFRELPSDAEYGSDFKYMITLIGTLPEYSPVPLIVNYLKSTCDAAQECAEKRKYADFSHSLTFAKDAIKQIGFTPCCALANLLDYYSIPDVLRINRFANKVEFTQTTVYDHSGSTEFESETILPPE